jgi:hypothetical protein
MSLKLGNIVASILLIAAGVFFYILTYDFTLETNTGVTGSIYNTAFFPRVVLALLGIFCVILIVQSAVKKYVEEKDVIPLGSAMFTRALPIWGLLFFFYFGWIHLGFLPTSIVGGVLFGIILGARSIVAYLIFLGTGPLLSYVFEKLLGIPFNI